MGAPITVSNQERGVVIDIGISNISHEPSIFSQYEARCTKSTSSPTPYSPGKAQAEGGPSCGNRGLHPGEWDLSTVTGGRRKSLREAGATVPGEGGEEGRLPGTHAARTSSRTFSPPLAVVQQTGLILARGHRGPVPALPGCLHLLGSSVQSSSLLTPGNMCFILKGGGRNACHSRALWGGARAPLSWTVVMAGLAGPRALPCGCRRWIRCLFLKGPGAERTQGRGV